MKLKNIILVLTAFAMVFVTACGGSDNGGSDSADGEEMQFLNTYVNAEPTTFDSVMATDTIAIDMITNLMEPLLRLKENPDGTVETIYAGAESYTVSEDGTVWTFKIRDFNWSDGEPVTAHDYEYGIKRVLDPDVGAAYSYIMMPIKNASAVNWGELPIDELGVKALSDDTLEITLEYPTSYFLGLVYHTVMLPQRQDVVELHGDQYGTEFDKVVYNGPYICQEWVHNSSLKFVKNDQYWDKDNVTLDSINYSIIQDENAIYNSLENNSIDVASTSSREWFDTFKANDELTHLEGAGANLYYQYYNQESELFSNVNVRKAFTLAIDREKLNETIYDGMNTPAYGVVPTGVNVNEKLYRDEVEGPLKALAEETEDPKALLEKGLEELGMSTDTSLITVELQLGGTDQWSKTLAEYMQQVYKDVLGVNLEIRLLDWGVFMTNFYNKDYEIAQMSFGADFNDPLSMLSSMESSQDGFCIGYGNERIDELLYMATEETDTDAKIEMIKEIEEIFLVEDACIAPITYRNTNTFVYNFVDGYSVSNFATTGFKHASIKGRSN